MNLQLRIYETFSEYRETVEIQKQFLRVFDDRSWNSLLPDSLSLEGVKVELVQKRRLPSALSLWQDCWVILSTPHTMQKVKLIHAEDGLVQDEDGRFFYIQPQDLMFTEKPAPRGAQHEVCFHTGGGEQAVLSYLTRALFWTAHLTLDVQNGQGTLTAWAEVINQTVQDLQVDQAVLIAGDVKLLPPALPEDLYGMEGRAVPAAGMERSMPTAEPQQEQVGLQMFNLTGSFVLRGEGATSLKVLSETLQIHQKAGFVQKVHKYTRNVQGKMQRWYEFEAPCALPQGKMTVRDTGSVVGQHRLSATTAKEKVSFSLGIDPDVNYQREIEVLRANKQITTHRVHLHLENHKDREVTVKYQEHFQTYSETAEAVGETLQAIPEGLQVVEVLQPGQKKTITYLLNFKARV
ncbi:hypothetical protein [Deinococcus cellulosilyticus]|uniref:DUF4139 domain-containing protein n=1 Tax=Deinococcus cellulosilyticus (strain DSM 18568 / NBRC 106333 / KACC 11606 / 5516J-15) TaxID=1223518 RepID=A0A511N526_DEIC1|nr:hypothetical protein [Deinococcus cellulosilyticus]GEM47950.1 hypothetical protein DC3_35850 [Deinococcus cellulosilyticus NBRC 106333 = KACC 11606]